MKCKHNTTRSKPFISIIILAAGLSTRFRRNKLLEKVDGRTLIERVASQALRSKVDQVIIVLGHDADRISEALRDYSCELVFNEEYMQGQSSSVKKGLSKAKDVSDAVMILPGDVVMVDSDSIDSVIKEYVKMKSRIVVAGYHGQRGHPILFDKELYGEIMDIDESTMGLKKVISKHQSDVRLVETSEATLFDLDIPEDFAKVDKSNIV